MGSSSICIHESKVISNTKVSLRGSRLIVVRDHVAFSVFNLFYISRFENGTCRKMAYRNPLCTLTFPNVSYIIHIMYDIRMFQFSSSLTFEVKSCDTVKMRNHIVNDPFVCSSNLRNFSTIESDSKIPCNIRKHWTTTRQLLQFVFYLIFVSIGRVAALKKVFVVTRNRANNYPVVSARTCDIFYR